MPFLIGVPAPVMQHVRLDELGEVVILDADANKITSPFRDLVHLPEEVVTNFRRHQKSYGKDLSGDTVPRLFLRAIVHLIGGYRGALKMRPGEKITFDDRAFVSTRSANVQPFLESILELQIFRQFIEDRLEMLNQGKGGSDEFEKEIVFFSQKLAQSAHPGYKIKSQAAAFGSSVKKESGAIVKAVKTNVNPAVKHAVKSVKAGGKSAYKGVKARIRENNSASNLRAMAKMGHSGSLYVETVGDNAISSAPASPTLNRTFPDGCSTGDSSTDSRKSGMFRTNTDLGFSVPHVLKYERFDPPLMSEEQSPEQEAIPPLNLDLMSELSDVINRKPSPLEDAAYLKSINQAEPVQDLISFQVSFYV